MDRLQYRSADRGAGLQWAAMVVALAVLAACDGSDPVSGPGSPVDTLGRYEARLETTLGDITIELFADAAPVTVANFREYVQDRFYDDLIFHRVIRGFVIQGGGYTEDLDERPGTRAPIHNEANNGLSNVRGTIAMVRGPDPHSATSQFYINTHDNLFLDHREQSDDGWGYCVFGRVVSGMDVVDEIEAEPTTTQGDLTYMPVTPIIIQRARTGSEWLPPPR